MRAILLFILLITAFQVQSLSYKHEASGVVFHFEYNDSVFPATWLEGRINGQAESLDSAEIPRTVQMLTKALAKYPPGFVKNHLKEVYVFSKLQFFGVGYGGTYHGERIYLTNKGVQKGYSDQFMEKVFHAEFSSILFTKFKSRFPEDEWSKVNEKDFHYGTGGVDAIKNGTNGESLSHERHKQGFITQYGMSDLENDLNSFAKHIFADQEKFWELVRKYPRIRKKADLLVKFYGGVSEKFTEDYFRKL